MTLEQIQARDKSKEERAKKEGFSVIRVKQEDVWHERINWQKRLVDAIDYIMRLEKPCVIKLWKE